MTPWCPEMFPWDSAGDYMSPAGAGCKYPTDSCTHQALLAVGKSLLQSSQQLIGEHPSGLDGPESMSFVGKAGKLAKEVRNTIEAEMKLVINE